MDLVSVFSPETNGGDGCCMCSVCQNLKRNLPGVKIAQHFSAGMLGKYRRKSRKGRQNRVFRPSRDFPVFCNIHPSAKALGYFRKAFLPRNVFACLAAIFLSATTSLGQKPDATATPLPSASPAAPQPTT